MNSRAEFEQGGVARVVIAQGLWRTISLWRIHRPTTTTRDGGARGGEEELEWLPAARVGGPHQSLNDHHLAQHQLQQRLLTSCNSVGGASALLASKQEAIWCGEFQWPRLFKGQGVAQGSFKLPLIGLWADMEGSMGRGGERMQEKIWRIQICFSSIRPSRFCL